MKKPPLRILLVEDNLADARLLREMFSKEKPDSFEFIHFLRMSEAVSHLTKGGVDIVLLDMGLPDAHGLDTVRRTHAAAPGVPVIVLTGLDDEAVAAEAIREGAQDYLIKGQIENRALPRALRHAIERHRLQVETDHIRTDQLQFKDEFIARVSHELRSPLTTISQCVSLLLEQHVGKVNPQDQGCLQTVLSNVEQLQSMIGNLLEVGSMQRGELAMEMQAVSAADAITYTVNTLRADAAAKDIGLTWQIELELPLVCADPTRLRQVLIMLVDNAIKFTPRKGAVQIHARRVEDDPNGVLLEVADSGCGISPDMTERIFERMVQGPDHPVAGRNGLGLGLYICKELVMRLGGEIWATSTAEQGSVFRVTLPVFSLPNLIAPALGKEASAARPLTLVVTQMSSPTGWGSEHARVQHSVALRGFLQQCLNSDLDVLLPKMSGDDGTVELFFILASTDAIGGEAICKRIRTQRVVCEYVQHAGLAALVTSYRSVDVGLQDANESGQQFRQRAANRIQYLIDEEISSRVAQSG